MVFKRILDAAGNIDTAAFEFINIKMHNEFAALLMKLAANDVFLVLVLGAGFYLLFKNFGEKEKRSLAAGLWAIITGNCVSGSILKPMFKRLRPFVEVDGAYMLSWASAKSYAFPSTHTVMAAALCAALWRDNPKARPYLASFLLLVAFFCVYTGGHYPGDVLAGALAGWPIGLAVRFISEWKIMSKVLK
ncbi:MAG: phosphatase PAP2 family protein [Spirochaetia bacterium]|nr:phosphatase PAP2 family protein [Spirochaetia bacterium]